MCTIHKYVLYNAPLPDPSDNEALCSCSPVSTLPYKQIHVQMFLLCLQHDQCYLAERWVIIMFLQFLLQLLFHSVSGSETRKHSDEMKNSDPYGW